MPGREDIFQQSMNEGHSAAWDQQWDRAAAAYQKALKEFPENPKALASLGLALFQQQRYEDALRAYQQNAKVAPNDPVPLEKMAVILERLGNLPQAIQASLQAAELYVKRQETEKAIENWLRVTQLDPDHLNAHSYLAMVHERLGQAQQAVTEYLAIASLYQRSGNQSKAAEMINRALGVVPGSPEARQAKAMLQSGQPLPKPMRPKGGTGPLRMAQVRTMDAAAEEEESLDPVAEARQRALTRLAEVLFEYSEDNAESSSRRGMTAIVRGTGPLGQQDTRAMLLLQLSQAIDAQTKGKDDQAAEELEHALDSGFKDPAVYFDLGLLRLIGSTVENGLKYLQQAVKHNHYALASRMLMGAALEGQGRMQAASIEFMEALKLADAEVVLPEQADEIRQLYEPLIEGMSSQGDEAARKQLCDNIKDLLDHPGWRKRVRQAREQLPKKEDGAPPMPLAEILTQAQSSQVIDAIGRVHQLARQGYLRTAMDEAFHSMRLAPNYLPLHTLIGDLLIQTGREPEAIAKYTVIAQAYSVRGEISQATNLLRRIIQSAPMDLNTRTRLVEQLVAQGKVDEALGEYLDLADIYYRLAELDMARKTYTSALRLAQQSRSNREWSVKILQRMADIDMQHLDWKQALRVFEQLRTLRPDEMLVRKNLIELNLRLNQPVQASTELENFLGFLQTAGHRQDAIPFLEELVKENPNQVDLVRALAGEYRQAGQVPEAVAQYDALGSLLLDSGDRSGAIQAIEAIIAMNPPNAKEYRDSLASLRG